MDATPLAQLELALATKLTGEPTVAPLTGLLTVTPARAVVATPAIRQTYTQRLLMPGCISRIYLFDSREVGATKPAN
jgi:hypothetical protein